jgi:hypothetical protein
MGVKDLPKPDKTAAHPSLSMKISSDGFAHVLNTNAGFEQEATEEAEKPICSLLRLGDLCLLLFKINSLAATFRAFSCYLWLIRIPPSRHVHNSRRGKHDTVCALSRFSIAKRAFHTGPFRYNRWWYRTCSQAHVRIQEFPSRCTSLIHDPPGRSTTNAG